MADTGNLFALFFVQATTLTGEGIPGVAVKVYSPLGLDITAQVAGKVNPVTNSQGVVSVYHAEPVLPGGIIYKIRLSKRGWNTLEFTTNDGTTGPINFVGYGFYIKQLTKASSTVDQYKVSLPPQYCSAIYPIGLGLESQTDERDERIITTVTHSSGKSSEIATDVDEAGEVYIDVHNRIRLKPIPVMVPEGSVSVEDRNFSDVVNIEVKAETLDGFLQIPLNTDAEFPPTLELFVANFFPDGNVNDLYSYVPGAFGLSKWITQLKEPICFIGYYLDVMIWLPNPDYYVVFSSYYDSEGNLLEDAGPAIISSPYVQRVAVNNNPIEGAAYVTMQIQIAGTGEEVSEILTIHYNYGY